MRIPKNLSASLMLTALLVPTLLARQEKTRLRTVDKIPVITVNPYYAGARAPLEAQSLLKLPIGSIRPEGWLRRMLVLESQGMTGHLEEISPWCDIKTSAWANPQGMGRNGWEEMPYWLKGFGDLGYVLKDPTINRKSRVWIEHLLANQRETGWIGPNELLTSLDGKPDLWPNMLVLNIMQSFYEATGDPRVIPFMRNYFRWELDCPEGDFLTGFWAKMRAGDNLESVYWLYDRTGEKWLLDLGEKIHRHAADWTNGIPTWHGVNIAQGFKEPAVFFMQSKDPKFLNASKRDYRTVMTGYGQVPGGMFGADENARPGYSDPRQAAETCTMAEYMHSFEMLAKITGETGWADKAEEVAFNSFPAAMTPDEKGLHYLTAPNQVQLDNGNKSPGVQDGGMMFAYSPYEAYRCCQHNVSHGWPYYAEELWSATPDRGLCANLYSSSEVSAKVGSGETAKLTERTDYPFRDTIRIAVSLAKQTRFPLYLRVPGWCDAPNVRLNGEALVLSEKAKRYLVLDRVWKNGDAVSLQLPMHLAVRRWALNKNAASVYYGPLAYSLKIGERWKRDPKKPNWPEWEVFPTTPWNYGLMLKDGDPSRSFKVVLKKGAISDQPFTPDSAPISLVATAKRISAWKTDDQGLIQTLQPSPVRSDQPTETVTLIPMGCARLRISSFPVIGRGASAHVWKAPKAAIGKIPASASHCYEADTSSALSDGIDPANSDDQSKRRFTWWDRKGSTEWVQYDFPKPRTVSEVSVYWFDDEDSGGGCRVPDSWRLLYSNGSGWKPVQAASAFGVKKNAYNRVRFSPVKASKLRIEVKLRENYSSGILQWRLE